MYRNALFKYVSRVNRKGGKMHTSKATQTTISQTSIFLHVLQFLHVQTQLRTTTQHVLMHDLFFLAIL